jgi:hypothetical protein
LGNAENQFDRRRLNAIYKDRLRPVGVEVTGLQGHGLDSLENVVLEDRVEGRKRSASERGVRRTGRGRSQVKQICLLV